MRLLEVQGLKKYYGNVKAVDGISFSLEEGQILALLGPNGAGKTTTVEILEGLRRKDEGRIFYFGREIEVVDETIKKQMGVQLQKGAFFENLTVRETIELFAGLYGVKLNRSRTREIVEMVMLEEKMNSRVKTLSGGQMQRLSFAVAIVNDPKIVFLDEPTTGLDPQARRHIWELIADLKRKGKGVLLTTHYMEEAERLADRILIMDHGKIIAEGTLDRLVNSLDMEDYVEFTVDNADLFLQHMAEVKRANHNRLVLATKNVEESVQKIFAVAKRLDLKIDDLIVRRPNLEDVFIHLTGRSLRD
ncbi:ABC transporter ATP-binding protein [Thermotoga caldifontis]|uniref:ABC transporter ATP-binding protein n=1 Tax=Thermotoga caldifontis TaxID=1508419 RepID=UPI000693424A|nr:ABC transporter ATP-binding protein [Thermotoga caldifontis]